MPPWHLVAEILELQAQLGVPALTGRWPPQARPSPPWCRPGWLGKPQEGFLSSEPWVCSACAVSEARDPGPLSWTDAAVCPTVGPATLSAPDNPCLLGGAASSPSHPLPLSGPASLRLCPHCCAHRNLTTAASRAPGQVQHGRLGLCRGPDCWPGGAPRDPCWRDMGHAPVCSPGGTVLYRPFCLCNINTDFYTSALWLSVLSIVFGSLPSASTWSLAHGWPRWLTTILMASAFWEAQQTMVLHTC